MQENLSLTLKFVIYCLFVLEQFIFWRLFSEDLIINFGFERFLTENTNHFMPHSVFWAIFLFLCRIPLLFNFRSFFLRTYFFWNVKSYSFGLIPGHLTKNTIGVWKMHWKKTKNGQKTFKCHHTIQKTWQNSGWTSACRMEIVLTSKTRGLNISKLYDRTYSEAILLWLSWNRVSKKQQDWSVAFCNIGGSWTCRMRNYKHGT